MFSRYIYSICPVLLSRASSSLVNSQWTLDAPMLTAHLDCPSPHQLYSQILPALLTLLDNLSSVDMVVVPLCSVHWLFFSEHFKKMAAGLPSL